MRSVPTALAAGLGITVAALAVVLAQSPLTVLASNSTPMGGPLTTTAGAARACQAGERLPRGTIAIRLSLGALTGTALTVRALSGERVVASGERGSGWDGQTVTVPVRAVTHTIAPVKVCFAVPEPGEELTLFGSPTGRTTAAVAGSGQALPGRLRIEYLGRGRTSWLALLPSVTRHMGLGRAWSGIWIAFLVPALMLAAVIVASRLIVRELDG
jgi:hypothetical protein